MCIDIVMENIEQIIRFRKKLEDLNDETSRDLKNFAEKYADLHTAWNDTRRVEFDQKMTLMSDFLKIYSRTLEDHIEYLKRVERAAQEYLDAGR